MQSACDYLHMCVAMYKYIRSWLSLQNRQCVVYSTWSVNELCGIHIPSKVRATSAGEGPFNFVYQLLL